MMMNGVRGPSISFALVVVILITATLSFGCVRCMGGFGPGIERKIKAGGESWSWRVLSTDCSDVSGWKEINGDEWTCEDYAPFCKETATWDVAWGDISDFVDASGLSPKEACCACGGGGAAAGDREKSADFIELEEKIMAAPTHSGVTTIYVYKSIDFANELIVTKGQHLEIVGVGDAAIIFDALNITRHFFVEADATLGLRNAHLINGFASNEGGAIHSYGVISFLIDCTFRNNRAGNAGGAVIVFGSKSRIGQVTRCIFEENACMNKDCSGGAMEVYESHLVPALQILNTTFRRNRALTGEISYGAGLFFANSRGSGIAISRSFFLENGPVEYGSALRFQDMNMNNIVIKDTRFEGNRATVYGGAIEVVDSTIQLIRACEFISNTAAPIGEGLWVTQGGVRFFFSCIVHFLRFFHRRQ